jgi:hypothetical protein
MIIKHSINIILFAIALKGCGSKPFWQHLTFIGKCPILRENVWGGINVGGSKCPGWNVCLLIGVDDSISRLAKHILKIFARYSALCM